jgi:hypothetical protein
MDGVHHILQQTRLEQKRRSDNAVKILVEVLPNAGN